MKKLLFQNFLKNTLKFFILICLSIGVIVWVIQAVNFLDFITEDGHGLYVYFSYTALSFPKIIHRILPFVYFISLFYLIIQYEHKNELIIFWTNGINKLQFINVVIVYSFIFCLIQIVIGTYLSPYTQNEARSYIRNSDINFFPSLIKEGRFIDTVEKLTIFIESKDESGNYKNIFLEESVKKESSKTSQSQTIYAKSGRLKNSENGNYFELSDGTVIDKNFGKVNSFSFKQIDFDLTKFDSKTTTYPKNQELHINILIRCLQYSYLKKLDKFESEYLRCTESNIKNVAQEVLKRLYKPIYIPLIGLLTCLLILRSKEDSAYGAYKFFLCLIMIIIIAISEVSLRYASSNLAGLYFFILFPIVTFLTTYIYLVKKLNIRGSYD